MEKLQNIELGWLQRNFYYNVAFV